MFLKIVATFFAVMSLYGCNCSDNSTVWEPGDKIVSVEPFNTGPRSTTKNVWIIYRKIDGTTYRKSTSENTTDGIVTVTPKDYYDGKTAYGTPSSNK